MSAWRGVASVKAPAKLNLTLRVVGRREDGYHLLESIVVPIDVFDAVRVRAEAAASTQVSIRCEPAGAAPAGPDNLAVRAAIRFLERVGACAHVSIELVKEIPAGAGMGGGSSNAAAVLRALNTLYRAPIPTAELAATALPLGADVPLFVVGGPVRMRGIGEVLDPWPVEELGPLVVAFSGGGLETKAVYAKYDDLLTMGGFKSTIRGSGQGPLRSQMHNDLEAAAFQLHPTLPVLKKRLVALGADSPAMTGSGAAIFGFWKSWDDAHAAAQQLRVEGVWARVVRVLEETPTVEVIDDERRDGGRSPSW